MTLFRSTPREHPAVSAVELADSGTIVSPMPTTTPDHALAGAARRPSASAGPEGGVRNGWADLNAE